MNRTLLISLLVSLVLTILLEIGFFLLTGKRNKKDLILVVLVNVLTNPIVVLLYWIAAMYTNWNAYFVKVPLELFAILTEGYYYKSRGISFRRPYLFSLGANMFSFWIGVLIQLLLFRRF